MLLLKTTPLAVATSKEAHTTGSKPRRTYTRIRGVVTGISHSLGSPPSSSDPSSFFPDGPPAFYECKGMASYRCPWFRGPWTPACDGRVRTPNTTLIACVLHTEIVTHALRSESEEHGVFYMYSLTRVRSRLYRALEWLL